MMELLSTISTAVNVVKSKLTQVIAAAQQLSDRQDRLEASIDHIKAAVSQPPPAATVSQPTRDRCEITLYFILHVTLVSIVLLTIRPTDQFK